MIHAWARLSPFTPTCRVKLIGNVSKQYLDVGLAYAGRECIETYGALKTLCAVFVHFKQQQTKTFFV